MPASFSMLADISGPMIPEAPMTAMTSCTSPGIPRSLR